MRIAVAALVVAAAVLVPACVSPGTTAPQDTVTLERTVHFTTAKGEPVVVAGGTYTVADTGRGQLEVAPAGGDPILLPTRSATHEEELAGPRFVSEKTGPDTHRIALELPWGVALEAEGTYSGTRPRGKRPMRLVAPAESDEYVAPEYGPSTRITVSATAFTSDQEVFLFIGTSGRHLMNPSARKKTAAEPRYVSVRYPLVLPHESVIEEIRVRYKDYDGYANMQCIVWACGGDYNLQKTIAGAHLPHTSKGDFAIPFQSPKSPFGPKSDLPARIWAESGPRIDNENLAYTIEVLLPQRYYHPAWFASDPAEMQPVARPDCSKYGYNKPLDTFGGDSRSLETHFVDVEITYRAPLDENFVQFRAEASERLERIEERLDKCEGRIEFVKDKVESLHSQ